MTPITRQQAHSLLMQDTKHYLWNIPYRKWTDEDYCNLMQGINTKEVAKPVGNKVAEQPVEMTTPTGEKQKFRSVAEAARKSKININSIYAVVNGRRPSVKKHTFIKINSINQ